MTSFTLVRIQMGTDFFGTMPIFTSVYTGKHPFQIASTLQRVHSEVQPRFYHFDPNLITKQSEICLDFDPYTFGKGSNRLH